MELGRVRGVVVGVSLALGAAALLCGPPDLGEDVVAPAPREARPEPPPHAQAGAPAGPPGASSPDDWHTEVLAPFEELNARCGEMLLTACEGDTCAVAFEFPETEAEEPRHVIRLLWRHPSTWVLWVNHDLVPLPLGMLPCASAFEQAMKSASQRGFALVAPAHGWRCLALHRNDAAREHQLERELCDTLVSRGGGAIPGRGPQSGPTPSR